MTKENEQELKKWFPIGSQGEAWQIGYQDGERDTIERLIKNGYFNEECFDDLICLIHNQIRPGYELDGSVKQK